MAKKDYKTVKAGQKNEQTVEQPTNTKNPDECEHRFQRTGRGVDPDGQYDIETCDYCKTTRRVYRTVPFR